jgi:hypothetical protein
MAIATRTIEDLFFDADIDDNSFIVELGDFDEVSYVADLVAGTASTVVMAIEQSDDLIQWDALNPALALVVGTPSRLITVASKYHRIHVTTPEGGTSKLGVRARLRKDT